MTRKTVFLSATALVLASSLSGCGSRVDESEYVVQVNMSEASYQNLYGSYAECDDSAGQACNPDQSKAY